MNETKRASLPETAADKAPEFSPDGFVTAQELLDRMLPVGRGRLRQMCQDGLIPYIRPAGSRKLLFYPPAVREALLRLQRGQQP